MTILTSITRYNYNYIIKQYMYFLPHIVSSVVFPLLFTVRLAKDIQLLPDWLVDPLIRCQWLFQLSFYDVF